MHRRRIWGFKAGSGTVGRFRNCEMAVQKHVSLVQKLKTLIQKLKTPVQELQFVVQKLWFA
eukprot:2525548-Karenia_brevis.AAC.1